MTDNITVEETKHSRLGASSAKRWMNCPGSIRLSKDLPKSAFSAGRAAAEGTSAHELAALCLESKTDAWEQAGKTFKVGEFSFEVDQDMVDAVQGYLDLVSSLMEGRSDAVLGVERSLSSVRHEQAFGTADVTIEVPSEGLLIVIDYKHGRNIECNPEEPQTRYYGYMAMENSDFDFDNVDMYIYQPRCPHPKGPCRKHSETARELEDWFVNELVPAMDETDNPDSLLKMGDWCQFCPAKAGCPALISEVKEFKVEAPVDTLTGDEIGELLITGEQIRKYVESLKVEAFRRLQAGQKIEGQKLVAKRSTRTWKSEIKDGDTVAELDIERLLVDKFGKDAYQEPKLKTVPNIEKLPGGKKFVSRFAYKPTNGLTMAASSDKRQEVKPLLDVYSDQLDDV